MLTMDDFVKQQTTDEFLREMFYLAHYEGKKAKGGDSGTPAAVRP
jgi:hypothetical protein